MVLLGKVKRRKKLHLPGDLYSKVPSSLVFLFNLIEKLQNTVVQSLLPVRKSVSYFIHFCVCRCLFACNVKNHSFSFCFAGKSVRSVDLIKQASEPGNWTIEDTGNTKIWERFEWFRLRVTQLWKGGKSAFPFYLISISASSVCLQDSIKVVRPPSQVPDGSSFTWCSLF